MIMQLADVLIHLNDNINESEKEDLVEQLRALNGVIAPRFNSGSDTGSNQSQQHLLLVSYNPETINSLDLLHTVNDKGYTAQLVGM